MNDDLYSRYCVIWSRIILITGLFKNGDRLHV